MAFVRFFALGGLGENGKNMYCVEVDKDLYVLDAGLKYPGSHMYGVDEIIPDYRMLIKAKKRIRGIFLTHAHEDHIGAIPYLIENLNVPVYGTKFTLDVLYDDLKDHDIDPLSVDFVEFDEEDVFEFESSKISFFNTAHSIPGSVGCAIHTPMGVVVYTSEYTMNQTIKTMISTNFHRLSQLSQEGVLALLTEAVGSSTFYDSANALHLDHILNGIFSTRNSRILVSLFSTDFKQIQKIFDLVLLNNKKIVVVGDKGKRIIEMAIKTKSLLLPKDAYLEANEENLERYNENLVILITGSRFEPFSRLQNIVNGKDDLLFLKNSDKIVLMTAPIPGTEKAHAKALDFLYRTDADITNIPQKLLSSSHATEEEIKIMINILSPKYIVPVIGEYRHQYGFKKIVLDVQFDEKNLFLMDNGDTLNFDGRDVYLSKGDIQTSEILIDGTPLDDEKDVVVRDREIMADDGTLIIVAHIDPKDKKVVGEPEIITKGFVYIKESPEVIAKIKEIFYTVSEKHLQGKYINWNDFKREVKDEIVKYTYQLNRRSPITIPVIISIEEGNIRESQE
ncbi:ribonuclease J [Acholeplasma sp. OttesenSCG-928-E16]|nr:ribonuclease J [Acholeplasma sp. OttesenSCG-928-E16]